MLHKFNKRPTRSHLKRNSYSFGVGEVSGICFNDDVEITVYDDKTIVAVHKLSGFVFLNSLVKKSIGASEFMVIKV